jgi:NitT/TauT family transport system substrate-binding protein
MSTRAFASKSLSRRRFLKSSALAGAALATPLAPFRVRAAGSLKPVSMTLDWVYQGPNAGYLVAHEQGFFRDAGLDVTITAGKGSASTAQLVASKASQIGFADGFVVGNGVSKGMHIKTVGSIFRRNPAAILLYADSPIKTPKDLEGKTIAISAGSAVIQQFPAFCKGVGIEASKVQILNIDPSGMGPALITGKVDGLGAYVSSYVPTLEIRGKRPVRIFWFADAGVVAVSNGMVVHDDLLKNDPDLVRAFVPAALKGFLYGRQHPDEAIAAVKKYQPTIDPAITQRELEVSWKLWLTSSTMGKPLGWGSDKDWNSTIEVLHQYGGVTAPLQPSDLYTNEFIPSGAEYVPPQEA